MKRFISFNKKGDTIVEVLIALTVLSLAMSISYSTVNSSINALSAARRAARATVLLQQQVELLRTTDLSSWGSASNYCVIIEDSSTELKSGDANCIINGYKISIIRVGNNYTASATWNTAGKEYKSEMYYAF